MDVLCEDIVAEILDRLPDCKTVIRFSAVCKRWWSVINSPDFKQRFNSQMKKKKNKECMQFTHLFGWELSSRPMFELSIRGGGEKCLEFLPLWKDMTVRASGGGLLAALDGDELLICNPLTKQWSLIPRDSSPVDFLIVGLACNPDNTHFKFVSVTSIRSEKLSSKVFCSESGAWTHSALPLHFPGPRKPENFWSESTQIGTTLYWLMEALGTRIMLAHDPFEQWARFVEVPHGNSRIRRQMRMGSVLGRLRLSHIRWRKTETGSVYSLKIWELKDDKRCWSLVHRVKPTSFPPQTAMVVGFHPNDGDKLFVTTDRANVCLYDIKSDTFQELHRPFSSYSPNYIKNFLLNFTILHPSSMPCPVPKFVNHRKRKAHDPQTQPKKTKRT